MPWEPHQSRSSARPLGIFFEFTTNDQQPAFVLQAMAAERFKNTGNTAFKRRQYELALNLYSQGIALAPDHVVLISNRAATLIELSRFGRLCQLNCACLLGC